jgi:hypothetical protein
MPRVIEYPRSDDDLPPFTRRRIEELVNSGWPRDVLTISERGEVTVDLEEVGYAAEMQVRHPGRPRSEYMAVTYPARICVDE